MRWFVVVLFVLAGILGFGFISASANNGPEISQDEIEAEVLLIAADYAGNNDLDMARERLKAIGLPNAGQYISFMLDRYIQEGRGPEDVDALNLLRLADALH